MKRLILEAAAEIKPGADNMPAPVAIHAYSGGVIYIPPGFVLFDLAGMAIDEQIPLLMTHEKTLSAAVGHGQAVKGKNSIDLDGQLLPITDAGRTVIEMAREGFPWQASVGVFIDAYEMIPPGQSVYANGQYHQAPREGLRFVTRSRLREISICPVGCDPTTSVQLLAAMQGSEAMKTFEEWLQGLGYTPDADGKFPDISEAQMSELRRAYDALYPADTEAEPTAQAEGNVVTASLALQRTRQRLQASEAERVRLLEASSPQWSSLRGNGDAPRMERILECSMALSNNVHPDRLARWYGQRTVDAAMSAQHRGAGYRQVFEHVLATAGMHAASPRMDDSFIRQGFEASRMLEASGFSTVSIPGILGNVANKSMLDAYESVETTWQTFCSTTDAKDFKPYYRYRLIGKGEFQEVAPDGEIKHIQLAEQEYSNQLDTFGAMISITRKAIVNDDAGALDQMPRVLGRMSAIRLEKEVYRLLMANTGNFFSVDNGNLLTGAGSILGVAGLDSALQNFRERLDPNGDPLLISPKLLLVPPALSSLADRLVSPSQLIATGFDDAVALAPAANPHSGKYQAVQSPWLTNENLTGNSDTKWYLFADPTRGVAAFEVGFLNGQKSPTITQGEMDFNKLGMQWRGVFDFGVAQQDHRAALRCDGA